MKKLTDNQKRSLADFLNNVAVTWVAAGIVAPFFLKTGLSDFLSSSFWSIFFTFLFLLVSQLVIKEVRA